MRSDRDLQVMREIDKLDKIGIDGVCAMLGDGRKDASGAFVPGVGLDPVQVASLRRFFEATQGHATNEQTIESMERWFVDQRAINDRWALICALENAEIRPGWTQWDEFLSKLTPGVDSPADILDQVVHALKGRTT